MVSFQLPYSSFTLGDNCTDSDGGELSRESLSSRESLLAFLLTSGVALSSSLDELEEAGFGEVTGRAGPFLFTSEAQRSP